MWKSKHASHHQECRRYSLGGVRMHSADGQQERQADGGNHLRGCDPEKWRRESALAHNKKKLQNGLKEKEYAKHTFLKINFFNNKSMALN